MRTLLLFGMLSAALISCNKKKYAAAMEYNDKVVSYVEQCEKSMRVWNKSNFMQEYTIKKHNTIIRLLNMQDSLSTIEPLSGDDSLRLMGLAMVDQYIRSFVMYDTVYAILSDSTYYPEDSIRLHTLLNQNRDSLSLQSATFTVLQKRFSERYGLEFMQ